MSSSKDAYMDLEYKTKRTEKPNLRFWTPAEIHESARECEEGTY